MPKHEFGIIDKISNDKHLYEEYEPNKYNCVSIHDDFITPILKELMKINTFFHNTSRPEKGLAYCGITLIPPTSLIEFKQIIDNFGVRELIPLSDKISEAITLQKYMIHYGI